MITWKRSGHKTKRYDLWISTCGKFFKKSCCVDTHGRKVMAMLKNEAAAMKLIQQDEKINKIQKCIDINLSEHDGYIVSEYAGLNITYRTVPSDYDEQLKIIDNSLLYMVSKYGLYHNDVLPRNFFVLSKSITLIDFDLSTIGKPSRRTKERPQFNTCQLMREKINNRWKIQ